MAGPSVGPLFLGIDLGTSSCKVAVVDQLGGVVRGETERYPLLLSPDGAVEQDPEAWWSAVGAASTRLFAALPEAKGRLAAVGATGQWSGTVAVDEAGRPLRRAILWMDTRGEPYVRALTAGFPSISGYRLDKLVRWLRKTGGAPAHSGKDSIAHILYLQHREPEVYRAARGFLEPKDYLNVRLTGTLAASWDHVVLDWVTDNRDPSAIRYDPALFRLAGVDPTKFPPLKSPVDRIGTVTSEAASRLGIPEGLPVVAGAGDMQASLVGTGCTRPYQYHLYLGTSSWLTAHVPYKRTDLFHNIASLPSAMPGSYLIVATQESAGSSLDYARDLLFGGGDGAPSYPEVDALAAKAAPAEGGLLFAPWLYGERAPVENRDLRGALVNLSLSSGRSQVLRAVMEGVAYNTRWIQSPVEKMGGHPAEPIRMAGGGARSALWCQILADVLHRSVEVGPDPTYATARGAALLGAVGTRAVTFEQIAASTKVVSRFVPDPGRSRTYDRMFERFLEFHRGNTRLFGRLNARADA